MLLAMTKVISGIMIENNIFNKYFPLFICSLKLTILLERLREPLFYPCRSLIVLKIEQVHNRTVVASNSV